MKLIDFLGHSGLNEVRFEMGATQLGQFRIGPSAQRLSADDIEAIATAGIDVPGEQIQFQDDGTLTYRGLRVLVYIRDISNYRGLEAEDRMPRFHVAACRTLQDMKDKNRFARYVVATRNDGSFAVNEIRGNKTFRIDRQLAVCQNCLARLSFNGFSFANRWQERSKAVADFDLKDFFRQYPRDLHSYTPEHSADTQPSNVYPDNWYQIAQQIKAEAHYQCCHCRLKPDEREFLHVHHIDGLKYNCAPSNLICVCIRCHAREHPHLEGTPDWIRCVARYGSPSP
jgi:5-methylcytosine-specific restriction endonuclease McrA